MKIQVTYRFLKWIWLPVLFLFLGNKGFAQRKTKESEQPKKELVKQDRKSSETKKRRSAEKWEMDLNNKGIGPIAVLELKDEIDLEMAKAGQIMFEDSCISCHRVKEQFAAPPVGGVLLRRSPEWVMNLLLNPMEMVERDSIARNLRIRYGMPMPDMGLTEKEARQLVEYFRTFLKE